MDAAMMKPPPHRGSEPDAPQAWRFSIEVAQAWSAHCDAAHTPGTRKVKLRSAMTMSPDAGGIFAMLSARPLWPRRIAGDGRQFVSWIHERISFAHIHWLIAHDRSTVPSIPPHAPLRMRNSCESCAPRGECRSDSGADVAVGIGTWLLQTESELVLKSRRVCGALVAERI